jgi:flavin-dependent dehydrogenase
VEVRELEESETQIEEAAEEAKVRIVEGKEVVVIEEQEDCQMVEEVPLIVVEEVEVEAVIVAEGIISLTVDWITYLVMTAAEAKTQWPIV